MATNGEMFQFIANFGPMLGELAARLDYLERRIEMVEGGAVAAPGGAPAPDAPDDASEFEFMGEKVSLKGMLEGAMPAGGMPSLMERLKNWKPTAKADAASAPAAAPAADTKTT